MDKTLIRQVKDNCINCMYSKFSESTIILNDIGEVAYMLCTHQNSPYYNEIVNDMKVCRVYVDSSKYFLKKDRKEKIDKINRKI